MHLHSDRLILAPTDLGNFLGCRHLASLDLTAAHGEQARPVRTDPRMQELRERGRRHEHAWLAHLRREGRTIANDHDGADDPPALGHAATLAAMRDGADVIYQAALEHGLWSGRADFLRRVETPSGLGAWSYEIDDTKLARETRAGTLLQLGVYSQLLAAIQGVAPAAMHVVAPGTPFARQSYRVAEYAAYIRLLQRRLAAFIDGPGGTCPDMVPLYDTCAWWSGCELRRGGDDHLGYVAGIAARQIATLRELGIVRLADLAALDPVPEPARGSRDALVRVREQARVQQTGRQRAAPYFELRKPLDAGHGLALLPEPADDDVFLDFEGDHFADPGVREYLLGYVTEAPEGPAGYTALRARTLAGERAAFERFMDVATRIRARNPGAHIYHFAPYEPAALKRLMGRHATRQVELDALLRGGAFVDLHAVVKRALIAGVERYSIKDLEPFFGYARAQDLRAAAASRRIVEHAVAAGDAGPALAGHFAVVEDYNREDCESAGRLRDWLEGLRTAAVGAGHALPRPERRSGDASAPISELDQDLAHLRQGLLEDVPVDPAARSNSGQARFALAHMMEFHRREDKAGWWEYFRLQALEERDLGDERRALQGLVHVETVRPGRAPLERYRYPPQDVDARAGDTAHDLDGTRIGRVEAVQLNDRTVDIKHSQASAGVQPGAVVLHNHVRADALRQSLMRLGEAVLAQGLALGPPYRAAANLLLRRPPPTTHPEGRLQHDGESALDAACRIAVELDGDVLAIQGPPGTGKTHTGGEIICALVRAGLRVGVTAVSHKVIVNLLENAAKRAQTHNLPIALIHRQNGEYDGAWGIERMADYGDVANALEGGGARVVGATPWCWAREDFARSVDVLIVDEAGQMSLANVLACAPAARSLVLLGDPQQLEQPLQSSHPEGSEVSALYHLLDGADTMPPDRGLFLDATYRLHPDIARFTSEIYYEGRLNPVPGLERQAIVPRGSRNADRWGAGLRYVPVAHAGNQARAMEEVQCIRRLVADLLAGASWRDRAGAVRPLATDDLLIVAPYNAQVAALTEALPDLAARIGTVDRFQGQEAPVVLYSMTSSSADDAPRGMEFLYNRFRFNVATSRAQALCILVGSPALFEPDCRTPRQMRMANGLCRFRELARTVPPDD